jgi:DNA-binding XRE family transcriptional regulator
MPANREYVHRDRVRGKLLKRVRETKKLSQKALAENIDVTEQTVYNWERGKGWSQIETIFKLCLCMGISIEDLSNIDVICNCEDVELGTLDTVLKDESRLEMIRKLALTNDCETSSIQNAQENE